MNDKQRIQAFVDEIWSWYARHKRELPWRDLQIEDDTQRAYMILVSEVMLQQTQVPRVKIIFRQFLEKFPDINALSAASNKDVIVAWKGMGYNSRALRLRDAAIIVRDRFNGVFPQELDELLSIKGIGAYTAAAIRNFAFGIPTPCIDTNIRRILHRTFVGPEREDGTWEVGDKDLSKIAEEILEKALLQGSAADWHAALMDFGSIVCTKRSPKWSICPLTAKGIMLTTEKNFISPIRAKQKLSESKEPGRIISGRFVPNRIIRGKIVDALREHPDGLKPELIGRTVAPDWAKEHRPWLNNLIKKLIQDQMLEERGGVVRLRE